MIRFARKRLTYANIIASLALLFAMSGGAYAATHYLINSTKQINPRVIRALEGKAGGLGTPGSSGPQGPQGKEGPQGKQGPAGAGSEGKEGKEGQPGKEGATGKEGAAGKEGPSSVEHWHVSTNSVGSGIGSPNAVKLAAIGPVTVWGHCYQNAGNTAAATYISSSQGATFLQDFVKGHETEKAWQGREALSTGTHYQISEGIAEGTSGSHETGLLGPNTSGFALVQNGTFAVTGFPTQGVWLTGSGGPACTFSGYVVVE
jgi:hypothetical protein